MDKSPKVDPVHLVQDADTGDRFLIYSTERGIQVELRYDGDTLWMSQIQMAELFGVGRTAISKHLTNIYEEGELDPVATSAKVALVRREGDREVNRTVEYYNLDAVISVGYRVSSTQGTQFRKWATEKLVQFATKGFVVDAARLKNPAAHDRISELRDIIRDIRSDEANVYFELKKICALCSDYDPKSNQAHDFFARMQAKIMYAVTSHTPSEMIFSRANADHPNMGLRVWSKDEVRKADVTISKNYLAEGEMKELNRLTVILLDIFEDQLAVGKLTKMIQAENLLNIQLTNLNRSLLVDGGRVKRVTADTHAHQEYQRFDQTRRALRHDEARESLKALKATEKILPKAKKAKS